jgi:YHS domain-containing protein
MTHCRQCSAAFASCFTGGSYHAAMEHRILKDPVCGMTVTEKSFYSLPQQGQTHYFCGPLCKTRFAAQGPRHAQAGAHHTAPAHRLPWLGRHRLWPGLLGLLAALLLAGRWLHKQ